MLNVTVQRFGDTTIFHCEGRITVETGNCLRSAVLNAPRTRVVVLDVAEVSGLDAAGVGVLVSLRRWAEITGVTFKLMNLTPRVEKLLVLTNTRFAFSVCSVQESLELLCRAMHQVSASENASALAMAG